MTEGYFFNEIWRMDWGLGNPNKTAGLIAALMVFVWLFAYIKKWAFWVALPLFTGLGICLIHTFSRGGLIALGVGILPLLFWAPRPWPWRRIEAVVVAFWIMVGATIYLSAHERYGQGIGETDRSIGNRLDLWQAGPAMMRDAPAGWGHGNSGYAFMQWYQPLDRTERYRTMVNSHLTWLVEFGWMNRFWYVAGWILVLMICWPEASARWRAPILGTWLAFGVAAIFSSVAESRVLWIVPVIGLIIAIIGRMARKQWPRWQWWAWAPVGASAVCLLLFALGGTPDIPVRGEPNRVVWGDADPQYWVIADRKVVGENYGRTLRRFLNDHPNSNFGAIGIVEDPEALPENTAKRIVVTGNRWPESPERMQHIAAESQSMTLVSPQFAPVETGLSPDSLSRVEVIFGEFSQSGYAFSWEQVASVRRLVGIGDFLPAWPSVLPLQEEALP